MSLAEYFNIFIICLMIIAAASRFQSFAPVMPLRQLSLSFSFRRCRFRQRIYSFLSPAASFSSDALLRSLRQLLSRFDIYVSRRHYAAAAAGRPFRFHSQLSHCIDTPISITPPTAFSH
jgi:hypothetical protein